MSLIAIIKVNRIFIRYNLSIALKEDIYLSVQVLLDVLITGKMTAIVMVVIHPQYTLVTAKVTWQLAVLNAI